MSFDVDTLKHTNVLNLDQLYQDIPLGSISDLNPVDDKEELRHIELMSKEVLTVEEEHELDLLTDGFVNDLNDQVSKIVF